MPGEHGTQTLYETRVRGALADGFKTTLYDEDRLRQLADADLSVLTNTIADYGSNTLTERDVVRTEVQRQMAAFQTPERTIELPGTGLEFENLQRFAAYYKNDNDTPSGTVKDLRRAGPDDIVFTFATPEVYDLISGDPQDTFEQTSLTGGNRLELVGENGLPDGSANTNGNTLTLDDDQMLYFTGDYIDLGSGQSEITKIQWEDIDGESYGPDDGILSTRYSGTHLFTAQGAWVKSTADLDAKIYASGDAEVVPVAFYMAPGTKAPSLV